MSKAALNANFNFNIYYAHTTEQSEQYALLAMTGHGPGLSTQLLSTPNPNRRAKMASNIVAMDSSLVAMMASNLDGDGLHPNTGLQPSSDGLQSTASDLIAMASKLLAMASNLYGDGLHPNTGLQPSSDGLQPRSDGLQGLRPNSDGIQPSSHALQPTSDGLQSTASDMASKLLAMAPT